MKRNDNDNIKEIFEEHVSRLCKCLHLGATLKQSLKMRTGKVCNLGDDDESW